MFLCSSSEGAHYSQPHTLTETRHAVIGEIVLKTSANGQAAAVPSSTKHEVRVLILQDSWAATEERLKARRGAGESTPRPPLGRVSNSGGASQLLAVRHHLLLLLIFVFLPVYFRGV